MLRIIHFQSLEGVFGTLYHLLRHAGHPGYMYAETVGRAAFPQFTQEDDLCSHFLHRDVEILNPWVEFFKVVQLVVVRGEQRFGAVTIFMNIFHYRPGDGHSVVGGCASADLV